MRPKLEDEFFNLLIYLCLKMFFYLNELLHLNSFSENLFFFSHPA